MLMQTRSISPLPTESKNQKELIPMITLIDACPQLLKDDKLLLRNKLKESFKCANKNDDNDIKALLNIFNNCKKPLNRIPKYQKDFHWFQVKLRKYVTHIKKQCKIQEFNEFKENTRNLPRKNSKVLLQKLSVNDYGRRQRRSSEVRSRSPLPLKQLVRNTKQSFVRKATTPTSQVKKSFSPFGYRQNKKMSTENKSTQLKSSWIEKKLTQMKESKISDYEKSKQQKTPEKKHESSIIENECIVSTGWEKILAVQNSSHICSQSKQKTDLLLEESGQKESYLEERSFGHHLETFRETNEKVNKILKSSRKVREQYDKSPSANKQIFTSPEIMAVCRRFLQKSHDFTEEFKEQSISKPQTHEIKNEEILQTPKIVKKISFQEYEIKKQTPAKSESSVIGLLREIFQSGTKVYISDLYKQELIKKAPEEFRQELTYLFTQSQQRGFMNFLEMSKIFSKKMHEQFHHTNIFNLLDLEGKGYVERKDFNQFYNNFSEYEIEKQVLLKIEESLNNVTSKLFNLSEKVLIGNFQYLELVKSEELRELFEILQEFQFEFKD